MQARVNGIQQFVEALERGVRWIVFEDDVWDWDRTVDLADYQGSRLTLHGPGEYRSCTLWRRTPGPMITCSDPKRLWIVHMHGVALDGRYTEKPPAGQVVQPALRIPAIHSATWEEVTINKMPGEVAAEFGGHMLAAMQIRRLCLFNSEGILHFKLASDLQWYGGQIERSGGMIFEGSDQPTYGPVIYEGVHHERNHVVFRGVRKLTVRAPYCWYSDIDMRGCPDPWYDGRGVLIHSNVLGTSWRNRWDNIRSGRD